MKHVLFAAMLSVLVVSSGFAKDVKEVNKAVINTFKTDFKRAADVNWKITEKYVKASFMYNNAKMEAFYTLTGERIGTSRSIDLEELPAKAKRSFAKKFSNYTVTEAIEFEGVEDTSYFISAENENESLILQIDSTNSISVFKRTKK